MKIEYTYNSVEGEPGPNLYFQGNQIEFSMLKKNLVSLVENEKDCVCLNKIDAFNIVPERFEVLFCVDSDGYYLSKKESNLLISRLPSSILIRLVEYCDLLSKKRCHIYVDFDDLDLVEEYNIIWSSEW